MIIQILILTSSTTMDLKIINLGECMTQKIKIELDMTKHSIKSIDIPQEINVIEAAKIFQSLAINMLNQVQIKEKKEDKIIPVKKNIITPN